jgi:hypothetical protein
MVFVEVKIEGSAYVGRDDAPEEQAKQNRGATIHINAAQVLYIIDDQAYMPDNTVLFLDPQNMQKLIDALNR